MASRRVTALRLLGAGAAVIGVAGFHTLLAAHTHLPIVQGDELGYIDNARYLALGGARPASSYFPGLSLFLIPVWWFTTHALTVWRAAEAVNIVAAVATMLGAVVLGGAFGLTKGQRWVVAVSASLFPPLLLYSDFSLSESLFQAVFMWLVVALFGAVRMSSVARWGIVGVLAGGAAIVHPRGFAVDVAVVIVAGLVLWRSSSPRPARVAAGAALVAGLVGCLGLLRVLAVATTATNVGGRYDYLPQSLIARNESVRALGILLVSGIGRLLYQSVATAGLVPLGLALGAIALVRLARADAAAGAHPAARAPARAGTSPAGRAIDAARGLPALSAVGVAGFTMLLRGTHADQLVQGRYVDAVVAPLLVAAMAYVMVTRRWQSWAAAGLAATAVSGLLFSATRHLARGDLTLNPANILGLESLVRRLGGVDSPGLTLIGLAAIAGLVAVARFSPTVAFAVLAVAFSVSAVDTQANFVSAGSAAKSNQTVLVHAIEKASTALGLPPDCVSYDAPDPAHGVLTDFNFFSDRLLLGTRPLQVLLPDQSPCGSFVISGRTGFASAFPGARLVEEENDVPESLYVLPGSILDRLNQQGWLLPEATPGPLPSRNQDARITLDARTLTVRAGQTRVLDAEIANQGRVSPWPAAAGLKQKMFAVRVATRWFPDAGQDGRAVVSRGFDLPRSLLPGESARVPIALTASLLHGVPLQPGHYTVEITVYQEGFANFGRGLTLPVEVTP